MSAVVSIARGDVGALGEFDLSLGGFWRSVMAVFLALPFAVLFTYAAREMWPVVKPETPLPPQMLHYAAEIVAFIVYWEALPLAAILITRRLHLTDRFVPFVVAWNWSNVVTALLLTPPIILFLLGTTSTESTLVIGAASTLLTVAFQARVAQVALGINVFVAIWISMLNLSFGMILAAFADRIPLLLAPQVA